MAPRRPRRLALDHNFPTPILAALADLIVDIELVPLRKIDPRLSTLDDRALVVALHQLGFQGLVMRPRNPMPEDPMALFQRAADHQHRDADALFAELVVSKDELRAPVLG